MRTHQSEWLLLPTSWTAMDGDGVCGDGACGPLLFPPFRIAQEELTSRIREMKQNRNCGAIFVFDTF
jgi:hypothetical protein